MRKNIKNIVLSTVVAGMIAGCGGGSSSSSSSSSSSQSGGAQKGPFKVGQTVTATLLDKSGNSTASSASTTTDALGKFTFSNLNWNGPTKFEVTGEYLDESTGDYIPGGLLTAITNVSANTKPNVNINILTHIAAENILEQMKNNVPIETATAKAKADVVKTFNIKLDGNSKLEDLDLTDSTDENNKAANTQLLKLSAALLSTDNPSKTLNLLVEDLKDGSLNDEAESSFEELNQKEQEVDLLQIAENLENVLDIKNVPNNDDLLIGTLSLDNNIVFDTVYESDISSTILSNKIEVSGIHGTSEVDISISGGEYSKDNGITWSSTSGKIKNGDSLQLRLLTTSAYSTEFKTSVTIAGVEIDFKVQTEDEEVIDDSKIANFEFESKLNADLGNEVESNEIVIKGINIDTKIAIVNGTYSINGGAYVSSEGTVKLGDTLKVKHTTSSTLFSDRKVSILTFGENNNQIVRDFKSYTKPQDKNPNKFSFDSKYDTVLDSDVSFIPITVSGISGNVEISVVNGKYSINNGAYVSTAGSVKDGDQINVQHNTSKLNNTKTISSLIIGKRIASFESYTQALENTDDIPNVFMFETQFNKTVSSEVIDSLTVTGIDTTTSISIKDGEYSLDNGSTWTSENGTVENDTLVQVRHTSSREALNKTSSILTIGGISAKLVSFTAAPSDIIPDSFSFNNNKGVLVETEQVSNEIIVRGINAETVISTENGEYSLDNGVTWTSITGTVQDNSKVKVKHTSSSENNSEVVTTLSIGEVSSKFVSITKKGAPLLTGTAANEVMTGSLYEFIASANDVISWEITNKPEWAIFDIKTGKLSGTPNNTSFEKAYENIIISAVNEGGKTSMSAFTITVSNFKPILSASSTSITKTIGSALSIDISVLDKGVGETHTFELLGDDAVIGTNGLVEINAQTGLVTNKRDLLLSDVGNKSFSVKVTDSKGLTDVLPIAFNVIEFNLTPVIPTISGTPALTVAQDEEYSFSPIGNDENSNTLVYSIANKPTWLNINTTSGLVSGTPTNANVGIHSNIVVSVTEGSDTVSLPAFSIEVTNINDAPTITGTPTLTVEEDSLYSFTPIANDVDFSDTLTFSIENKPTWATFNVSTGLLTGTPTNDNIGITSGIVISVKDISNSSVSLTSFDLEVTNTNDAPTASNITDKTAVEDTPTTIDLISHFTDVDVNDTLTYDVTFANGDLLPTWMDFNAQTAILIVSASNDHVGEHMMKITATDSSNEKISKEFKLTVSNVNDVPIGVIDAVSVNEDSSILINVLDNDTDVDIGDILTLLSVTTPAHGTAVIENGQVRYTPVENYNGDDSFTYIAKDSSNEETEATTVNVTVTAVNDAPIVEDITINVVQNESKSGILIATDIDDNTVTFNLVTQADSSKGSVVINSNGTYTFTATTGAIGSTSFTYKANDGDIDSETKRVTVTLLEGEVVEDIISPTLNWDSNDYFDLSQDISSSSYTDLIGLSTSELTSISALYEFENENHDGKRSLYIGKNVFNSTNTGFDWNWFSLEGSSFVSDDDILGVDKVTIDENELIVKTDFKDYRLKFLGEINANNFNDSTHTVFGNTGKAYGVAIKVVSDSYGFDEKARDWSQSTETYFTTINEFITAYSNDMNYFKSNESVENQGLAFKSGSTGISGDLVEVKNGALVNAGAKAGTWEIVTVNNRSILKITPTLDAYDTDEDLTVFTEVNNFLYRGWMDIAGKEFGTYFLDETAKDDIVAYYDALSNGIKAPDLEGQKIVNGDETYYFKANNEVTIGDTSADYTTYATYSEESDGSIKVLFHNDEYDVITREDYDYSVVFYEYNNGSTLEASDSETLAKPVAYNETDSDYVSAIGDIQPITEMVAVDPYISGAQFCYDVNTNNVCDTGEQLSTITDNEGNFEFDPGLPNKSRVLMKTQGTHNGEEFTGILKATSDINNVNHVASPSTTMIENGFTVADIVSILSSAGLIISEADLYDDPIASTHSGNFTKIQAAVAIHTFLNISGNYGLSKTDYDSNSELQALFPEIVGLIKGAINPVNINQNTGINANVIINVGVAISNYLVKRYQIDGGGALLLDLSNHITELGTKYATNPTKHFRLNDSGLVEEINSGFTSFGIDWKINKPNDERYTVSDNEVKKDIDSETIIFNLGAKVNVDSRSEVRKYFSEAKSIVTAKIRFKEVNAKSKGQVMAVMEDVNEAEDRIYATVTFTKTAAYAWIGKYDKSGNNEIELLSSTQIADLDTLSPDGSIKHTARIEVVDNIVKFYIQKVDGTKTSSDDGFVLETFDPITQALDSSFDLGIDRLQLRGRTDLRNINDLPSETTKFRVHYVEVNAGNSLSQATKDAINTLENIDVETQDINNALTNAKNILDTEITDNDSADAKLAKTLIRIAEIANSEAVSSVMEMTSTVGSDVSYLNQIVRSTALDAIEFDIKDNSGANSFVYTDAKREVLHNFAIELKQISDNLEALFTDKKTYAYDGSAVNYKDSIIARSAVLAAAFKLEYLSAYRFGSDDDLKIRTEIIDSMESEYMNLNIDPASVINSGNFLKLEDGTRVDNAKAYAIEALTTVIELPVGFEDITQEDKDDALAILASLESSSSPYIFEPSDDEEIKSISIDLSALYSASSALSYSDFGSTWGNVCSTGYTYDLIKSKKEDDIICSNGNNWEIGDIERSVLPTISTSKIDNVIKNITKLDNTSTVLTGQEILDFIFEEDENSSNNF